MYNKSIEQYVNEMKELQEEILSIIENDFGSDEYDESIKNLTSLYQNQNYLKSTEELKTHIYCLSKITKYHHRQSDFFKKIKEIFNLLEEKIKNTFSNFEIFYFFKKNLRMILFLIQNNILKIELYRNK